jgi:hypothetical protein
MQRYDSGNEIDPECYPCADGEWVKYEDVKELIELDEMLKELYRDTKIEFTFKDKLVGVVGKYYGGGG